MKLFGKVFRKEKVEKAKEMTDEDVRAAMKEFLYGTEKGFANRFAAATGSDMAARTTPARSSDDIRDGGGND